MIFRRPGSPNWYVRLRTGGMDRWLSLRTPLRREAEARAARLKYAGLPDVIRAISPAPAMALSDLWTAYLRSADLKPSTLESYEAIFRTMARSLPDGLTADRVSAAHAEAHLRSIANARTANLARGVLSKIWRSAALPDPWAPLPTRRGRNTPFRPLTDAEVLSLLPHAPPDWRDLILLAVYTGLRLTDAIHLRREQISADGSHLELRPAKTARSGRAVWVPIHPEIRPMLARRPSPLLFPALARTYDQSRPVLTVRFRKLLAAAKIKAGDGDRIGFHSLRVSFATRARLAGVPADDLRGMLGHSTSAMTRHYVVSPEALSLDRVPILADGSKTVAKTRANRKGKPRKSLR